MNDSEILKWLFDNGVINFSIHTDTMYHEGCGCCETGIYDAPQEVVDRLIALKES